MADEIQRADQRLRRTTAIVLAIAVLAAFILHFVFRAWVSRWVAAMPATSSITQLRRGAAFALLASGVCVLLLGGYAARMATRVNQQRRWPLEGARVLKDTPIRCGTAALRIGLWLNIGAVALTLVAIAVSLISWQFFKSTH